VRSAHGPDAARSGAGAFAPAAIYWGKAEEVPGTAALNSGDVSVNSVSCASTGNCVAGGQNETSSGDQVAFVDSDVGATWMLSTRVITWEAGLAFVSGATCETFSRYFAGGTSGTMMTGTVYAVMIPLPPALTVNGATFTVKTTAASSVTPGWYALLDSSLTVRAVTDDQTLGNWTSMNTPVTIAFTLSGPYTLDWSGGPYYLAWCITAGTMPNAVVSSSAVPGGLVNATPQLCGTAGTGSTPPTYGTQLNGGVLDAASGFLFHAYTVGSRG
jgi:hypothetical protein